MIDHINKEETCCKYTCCADGCCSEGCETGECSRAVAVTDAVMIPIIAAK